MRKSVKNAVNVLKSVTFGPNKMSLFYNLSDETREEVLEMVANELVNKGVLFPDSKPNHNPMLEEASTLQQNIVTLVNSKRLSFAELSKLTGIPASSIQRYVSGYTPKIPVDAVEKFAKAFGVSPADLCGWN